MELKKRNFFISLLKFAPLILLFISVLNEFDFNYLNLKYFSFNFPFILIYYWSLKRSESLGYGYIFIAGLINDVVVGFPIGFTSVNYLLICGFAAYLRNITLRQRMIHDWFFFLFTILVVNSLSYLVLVTAFSTKINYIELIFNILFTFLLFIVFANLFEIFHKAIFKEEK